MDIKTICARCGKEIERNPPVDNGWTFPDDAVIVVDRRNVLHTYHRECYKAVKDEKKKQRESERLALTVYRKWWRGG